MAVTVTMQDGTVNAIADGVAFTVVNNQQGIQVTDTNSAMIATWTTGVASAVIDGDVVATPPAPPQS